jgi:predicted acyltransferase
MAEDSAPQPAQRLAALDTFRGIAVAGMIIVNTPGSWQHVWWPLDHAEWHGFTPTDLVFPAFLCAVGAALGLSFPRAIDGGVRARVIRRSILLILLGWAFQMLAHATIADFRLFGWSFKMLAFPTLADFRVFGVLPRIGLCYFLAAAFAILTAKRDEEGRSHLRTSAILAAAIGSVILYWALIAFVPVPGYGAGQLTPEGNLAGYFDRITVTTAHMWHSGTDAAGNVVYDPEGLLSTLSALANVFFGMLAAIAWKRAPGTAIRTIAIAGAVLIVLGVALSPLMPLNKRIWTPTFAMLTSGLSATLLIFCVAVHGSPALRKLFAPLDIFGMNAITGYILSLLIALAAERSGVGHRVFDALATAIGEPYLASFLYAVIVTLIVLAALVPLHRRGIHLRL